MSRRRGSKFFALLAAAAVTIGFAAPVALSDARPAAALANASDFNPGLIIADSLFYDASAMTQSQIQQFLDSNIGGCTNGQCINVLQVNYPGRAREVSKSTGNLVCDTIAGGLMPVSQLIYEVQTACGISAKVILVTLQKEQGLVTSRAPSDSALENAMGQGCPDTAPCDTAQEGVANQIVLGTRQLKAYKATDFGRQPGPNYIQYDTNTGCGGTTIDILDYATAALYNYTPYQPNAAALANLYGVGVGNASDSNHDPNCSSYGNRNFWRFYNDWFGSTGYTVSGDISDAWLSLGGQSGSMGVPTSNATCSVDAGRNVCYQTFSSGGEIFSTVGLGAFPVYGQLLTAWTAAGGDSGTVGFPTSASSCIADGSTCMQYFTGGLLVWNTAVGAHLVPPTLIDAWGRTAGPNGPMGPPAADAVCTSDGSCTQIFTGGEILAPPDAAGYAVPTSIQAVWNVFGAQTGELGFPDGDPQCVAGACVQSFQHGVLGADGSGGSIIGSKVLSAWTAAGGLAVGVPTGPEVCDAGEANCAQAFTHAAVYVGALSASVTGIAFDAWKAQNSSSGPLGYPLANAVCDGNDCAQGFSGGVITTSSGAATVVPNPLGAEYLSVGGLQVLGAAAGPANCNGADPCWQPFERGWIAWTQANGAHAVDGWFLAPWKAQGSGTGRLGSPLSDMQCVPQTCFQSFEGGMLAATPSGSIVSVFSAYASVWDALGGPGGSLGLPTSGEVCNGHDCSQTFQGGVVDWSPSTGVNAVDGWFLAPWKAQGSGTGRLGSPLSDMQCVPQTCFQSFEGGMLAATPSGSIVSVFSAYASVWDALGGPGGSLGLPTSGEVCNGHDCSQTFQGGVVDWSPSTGVNAVDGWFLAPWKAQGSGTGRLGSPLSDMQCVPQTCFQSFEGGMLAATPSGSIVSVFSAYASVWDALGGPGGSLGLPTSGEVCNGSYCEVGFEHGVVVWSPSTGVHAVFGAIAQIWQKAGAASSSYGLPTSDAVDTSGTWTESFQHGTIVAKG